MTNSLKAVVLGVGIAFGMTTAHAAAQQPQYQGPMPAMSQGMGQAGPMMNDPQMRAQMSQMQQGCQRMMTDMRNRMQQARPTRR